MKWHIQARAVLKDSKKLLCLSLACSIDWPDSVYGSAILDTEPGGQVIDRFDSSHSCSPICTLAVPTIRKSKHPIRGFKVEARIWAEAPVSLAAFEEEMKAIGLSDVSLEVEEHRLHVNKVILATASPVFKSMFFGHFSEANDHTPVGSDAAEKVVPLPNKDLSLVLEMLCTIYPPQIEITTTRAKFLLPLFMEYQMAHMVAKCESTLCQADIYKTKEVADTCTAVKSSSDLNEAMDHLLLCSVYKMDNLLMLAVLVVARQSSQDFENHDIYDSLSLEAKNEVYKARVRYLEKKISDDKCSETDSCS